jgi:hypothetical protein
MRQLDMFRAEVIAFPLDRRWFEVMQAAKLLDFSQGKEINRWWRKTCRKMADGLRSAGVPESEVRRQILAFQDAVQIEVQRLARQSAQAGR